MDLFEYQARDIFEKHGVPVLQGIVATTPEEAKAAAEKIGGVTVVKAQVKVGGRGKAGGVKVAKTADEAYEYAQQILGMDIKGHTVHRVMIAQGADIAEEYYFSVLLDRANRSYLAMCSVEGGMEIEQLAVERPDALARVDVNPAEGITEAKAREIVEQAKFDAETAEKVVPVLVKLGEVYTKEDATLVEVNPLVKTGSGDVIALDGKVTLDDNAAYRQEGHGELVDTKTEVQVPQTKQRGYLPFAHLIRRKPWQPITMHLASRTKRARTSPLRSCVHAPQKCSQVQWMRTKTQRPKVLSCPVLTSPMKS